MFRGVVPEMPPPPPPLTSTGKLKAMAKSVLRLESSSLFCGKTERERCEGIISKIIGKKIGQKNGKKGLRL